MRSAAAQLLAATAAGRHHPARRGRGRLGRPSTGRAPPTRRPSATRVGACQARARDGLPPPPPARRDAPPRRHLRVWGEWGGGTAVSRPPPPAATAVCEGALSARRWGRRGRPRARGPGRRLTKKTTLPPWPASWRRQSEARPGVARYQFEEQARGWGARKGLHAAHGPRYFIGRAWRQGFSTGVRARALHPPARPFVATAPRENKKEQNGPLCVSPPPPAEAEQETT